MSQTLICHNATWSANLAVASLLPDGHQARVPKPSPLDDPLHSAHAWKRYRRLMAWMAGFTLVVEVVVLTLLSLQPGEVPIHFYIATGLGIGVMMLLMGALMGLVFLSSGTGHDEAVSDPHDEDGDTRS